VSEWFTVADTLLQVPISTIIWGTAAMGTWGLALCSAIADQPDAGHSCGSYNHHFIRRPRWILTVPPSGTWRRVVW